MSHSIAFNAKFLQIILQWLCRVYCLRLLYQLDVPTPNPCATELPTTAAILRLAGFQRESGYVLPASARKPDSSIPFTSTSTVPRASDVINVITIARRAAELAVDATSISTAVLPGSLSLRYPLCIHS